MCHVSAFVYLCVLDLRRAQLGLAHSYSRAKVKFNVNKVDNMVIQAIALLDTLDKDINTFIMRVREWYSWHFPELVKVRDWGAGEGAALTSRCTHDTACVCVWGGGAKGNVALYWWQMQHGMAASIQWRQKQWLCVQQHRWSPIDVPTEHLLCCCAGRS